MEEIFRLKAQKDRAAREAAEREKQQQLRPQQVSGNRRFELEDDMDIDENNNVSNNDSKDNDDSSDRDNYHDYNGNEGKGKHEKHNFLEKQFSTIKDDLIFKQSVEYNSDPIKFSAK